MAATQPSNASEWQLYRVLQRANLLQYYETFIAQGGDDVQQLCEAGEEEFLEIMALVGMASKPLHVRRLQKALQEWVANPDGFTAAFQGPGQTSSSPAPGSITAVVRDQNLAYPLHSTPPTSVVNAPTWNPQVAPRSVSPAAPAPDAPSPSSGSPQSDMKDINLSGMSEDLNMSLYSMQPTNQHSSSSPLPIPVLVQSQIDAIAEAATRLAKDLPTFEAKELNMKKQINREIQGVMQLTDEDPNRLDELRKYAAIYGRFDSKRKNDRPMSLHEISVNEAAAQLCRHMPTLLTRREDLFPLARQVVRDSGYQYSKGHSSVVKSEVLDPREIKAADIVVSKKPPRLDPVFQRMHDTNPKAVKAELDKIHREERMNCINKDLVRVGDRQDAIKTEMTLATDTHNTALLPKLQQELDNLTAQHMALVTEKNELIRKQKRSEKYLMVKHERGPYDDDLTDSSNFPSGNSSPLNSNDVGDLDLTKVALCAANFRSSTAQKIMQETLFDEGLRIAQQYGMADFAEEIKGLKSLKLPGEKDSDSEYDSDPSSPSDCLRIEKRKRSHSESCEPETNGAKRERRDSESGDKEDMYNNNEIEAQHSFYINNQNSNLSGSSCDSFNQSGSPNNSFNQSGSFHNSFIQSGSSHNSFNQSESGQHSPNQSASEDEAEIIKAKMRLMKKPNLNGSAHNISKPVQNGD